MSKKRTWGGRRVGAGRPVEGDRRRNKVYQLRLTPKEFATLHAQAKREGTSVAALLMRPWRKED
jgi:hypothetical protein